MKSSYLRAGLALLCAVILSACGGNDGNLALSGTINYVGPAQAGLVLVNKNTGEKLPIDTGVTSFTFTKLLAQDEQFDVEVDSMPSGAKCVPTANTGKANIYTAYYVVITCTANPYTLGGTVVGLKRGGVPGESSLVLANGADSVGVLPNNGADVKFAFQTKVANGALYGVTVLQQPTGQTCKVDASNNPGTMPKQDLLSLLVTCQ